jgi:hypothetical protein
MLAVTPCRCWPEDGLNAYDKALISGAFCVL